MNNFLLLEAKILTYINTKICFIFSQSLPIKKGRSNNCFVPPVKGHIEVYCIPLDKQNCLRCFINFYSAFLAISTNPANP